MAIYNINQALQITQAKDNHDKDEIRAKEQEKLYTYYSGDKHNILDYLDKALAVTYDVDDINEMQKQWVNLTEKFVNQLAVVYLNPAVRKLVSKTKDRLYIENESMTNYYTDIMPEDLNTEDKWAHRLGKLQCTVLTQVMADNKDPLQSRIKYKTMPSNLYKVKYDEDTMELLQVSYEKYYGDEAFTIVWEPTAHYRVDANSNKSTIPGRKDQSNPLGILPFARMKLKKSLDFWGEGLSDVVHVNEQINFLLTKVVNSDILLGTEGTILGINLQAKTRGREEAGIKKIRVGRKHPLTVEDVHTDMVSPDLKHISFDPQIGSIMDFVDRYIILIANTKSLDPKSFLSVVKDTSDYQTLMGMVTQIEVRRDDIEPLRVYEKERFNITKAVNNYYSGVEGYKFTKIPDNLELDVDFADVEAYKTTQDIWLDRAEREKRNMGSAIDWLKEDNPDLTDEEAIDMLNKNKEVNQGAASSQPPNPTQKLIEGLGLTSPTTDKNVQQ